MGFESHVGVGAAGGDDVGAKGQIRHEVAVHDVPLDAVDSRFSELATLLAEIRKVGGKNRGNDFDRASHELTLEGAIGEATYPAIVTTNRRARASIQPTASDVEPTTLEVVLDRPADSGAAVARDETGRVVFAHGGLAGETVRVELATEKKSFARGHVVEVLNASPDRQQPECPTHSAGCGGCDLAHAKSPAQTGIKHHVVRDALIRIGRIDADAVDEALASGASVQHSTIPDRYRTTVRLGVDAGRVGYRKQRSNVVVAPDVCTVAHSRLEELISAVRVDTGGGDEVMLRVSAHTDQAVVATNGDPSAVSTGPFTADVVSRDDMAGHITELAGGQIFQVAARSFFQAGPEVATALVDAVRHATGAVDQLRVVDAYAGVGLFAATVGHQAKKIVAIEQSTSATADAQVNLAHLNAEIVIASVDEWSVQPADIVIADPSRAGLGSTGVEVLASTGAHRFVLVSCDTGALGRDVGLLLQAGFALDSAQIIDAFRNTSHVETVVELTR